MCNRYIQDDVEIRPGQRTRVLMRGPGGEFEVEFKEAVFGGPAKRESRGYWIKKEGAEDVRVPNVSRFGEKSKASGQQGWEDVTPGWATADCTPFPKTVTPAWEPWLKKQGKIIRLKEAI